MNFSLIRNELLTKIDKVIFSQEDIKTYLLDLINYLGLHDYTSDIIFDDISNDTLATYCFHTRKIKININNIIRDAKSIYPFIDDNNLILFINLSFIEAILHEVVHIFQNYLFNNENYSLLQLYLKEFIAADKMEEDDYSIYYNCFIFEREAIVTSLENILIILKNFIKNDKLFEYYLEQLTQYLTIGYKSNNQSIVSPIEILFNYYFKESVPTITNLDIYDTLKLGFQINKDNFILYNNKARNLILEKNNLQ